MAKYSENPIMSSEVNWNEADPDNGLLWSGKSIREFQQQKNRETERNTATKVAASYFEASTMSLYQFASEEDKELWLSEKDDSLVLSVVPFVFNSTLNQIKILNHQNSTNLYFTTENESALLNVGFLSQQKDITDTTWEEVNEDFSVSVAVDKGSKGNYETVLKDQQVFNGNDFTIDVKKYLANGANRVKISVKGVETGTTKSIVFTVNLTSMYLSGSDFAWNRVFVEGESFSLGGLYIGGNLPKILKINVTGNGYEKLHEVNIGAETYVNTTYSYSALEFPATGSGVYHVELWLDANGLESAHLHYNIICVAAADKATAQFVALNDISESVPNGIEKVIFGYTLYDKGLQTSSVDISINVDGKNVVTTSLSGEATAEKRLYSSNFEYATEATGLNVEITVTNGNTVTVNLPLDNSASYPAISGASLYINEAARSNSQANREKFINEATGEEIAADWQGFVFDNDAHTTDNEGRKCLYVPAGASVSIDNKPLRNWYNGGSKSIEFAFKVANASDYNENIITIADADGKGIQIKPKNVLVRMSGTGNNDVVQSYNLKDEEFVHLLITFIRGYQGYGNLCQIYVNGIKTTSFDFGSENFVVSENIIIGSTGADIYLYKMRVYERGFEWMAVSENLTNCLYTKEEKVAYMNNVKSILAPNETIDYDTVCKEKKNTFVVEMLDGASLPDKLHQSSGKCNTWINIVAPVDGELDSDFKRLFSGTKIENQEIEGQGTTAMTYYRWNVRQKLGEQYGKRRITAKKNVASSMHSHKMGATRMYNELHNAIVGANEANARVAIYQYPVYGFQKFVEDGVTSYKFIGLYTIGPDKSDSKTFGYDKFADSIIHLEGSDHTPMSVGYDYPWSELQYSAAKESLGAVNSNGEIVTAWEVGAAGTLSTDEASDAAAVKAMLDAEFKPAYEVVYNSSPFIKGLTDAEFAEMVADPVTWRKKSTEDGKSYSELEFYDSKCDLYYYNQQEGIYKKNGINLLTQTALIFTDETLAEKDEAFKAWRRDHFKANVTRYWDLNDALFHDAFIVLIGASDNFKKNNYPYKLKPLAEGGLWQRRQDDLDTIFDILNQGFAGKTYSVLFGDKTSSGSVFRGENSVFHTLIQECYPEEIKKMMHSILDKMSALSPYGQGDVEKLVGYIKSRFWDYAQDYFTPSAYNIDAEWTYEEAWKLWGTAYNADVHPLQQSLGAHYEAERDWVALRMLFIASYFNWGIFASGSTDSSEGQLSYRTASGKTFTITPAIDLNPTILVGDSEVTSAGGRIKAGEKATVIVGETGNNDTHVYVQGLDWISDLGDLSDLSLTSDNASLTISSKRLKSLKLGGEEVVKEDTTVESVSLGSLPSLEEIDARNTKLKGNIDLSKCPRIKTALFGGSDVSSIALSDGSKITRLQTSEHMSQLVLKNLPYLTEAGFEFSGGAAVEYLRVEGCKSLDGFELLSRLYNLDGNKLKSIRIIGFTREGTNDDVEMLINLANNIDKDGNFKEYNGIDESGNIIPDTGSVNSIPVLEGTINVTGGVYEDDIAVIESLYDGKVAIVSSDVIMFFKFADPEVKRIVIENWGDGNGITAEQIKSISSIDTVFRGNTVIESFEEFKEFTGVQQLAANAFNGCENLQHIAIPDSVTFVWDHAFRDCKNLQMVNLINVRDIGQDCFNGCSNIKDIFIGKNARAVFQDRCYKNCSKLESFVVLGNSDGRIGTNCFEGCTSLKNIELPENTSSLVGSTFYKCSSLTSITIPNGVTSIANHTFFDCTSLTNVKISDNVTNIGGSAFNGCLSLNNIALPASVTTIGGDVFKNSGLNHLVVKAETPPTLSSDLSFVSSICVPEGSLQLYKEATGWITYADKIKSISTETTIITSVNNVFGEQQFKVLDNYGENAEVTWSLSSGGEFATITQDGLLLVNKGVMGAVVVVRATRVDNPAIFAEKTCTVYSIEDAIIDEEYQFTPASVNDTSQIIQKDYFLLSKDFPRWTISVNGEIDYSKSANDAALIHFMNETGNYAGVSYSRNVGNSSLNVYIRGLSNNNAVFQPSTPVPLILRRNGNYVEYSTDGINYVKSDISDINTMIAKYPRVATIPLSIGGYYSSGGAKGRPLYGKVRIKLYFDVVDAPIIEL